MLKKTNTLEFWLNSSCLVWSLQVVYHLSRARVQQQYPEEGSPNCPLPGPPRALARAAGRHGPSKVSWVCTNGLLPVEYARNLPRENVSFYNLGSDCQCPHPGPLASPHSTGPVMFLLRLMGASGCAQSGPTGISKATRCSPVAPFSRPESSQGPMILPNGRVDCVLLSLVVG